MKTIKMNLMHVIHNINIMKCKVAKCMIRFMGFVEMSIFTRVAWTVLDFNTAATRN